LPRAAAPHFTQFSSKSQCLLPEFVAPRAFPALFAGYRRDEKIKEMKNNEIEKKCRFFTFFRIFCLDALPACAL